MLRPIDLFAKAYDLPPRVRDPLMSAAIPHVIPLAAGLKIKILTLDEAHAQTRMPFSRKSQNHVGSMYLAAMFIQSELTMAALVLGHCRPPAFRVLVKRSEVDFAARATSPVTAVCRPDRAELDRLGALRDGKGEAWLPVTSTVAGGTIVAQTRFLISVKHTSR